MNLAYLLLLKRNWAEGRWWKVGQRAVTPKWKTLKETTTNRKKHKKNKQKKEEEKSRGWGVEVGVGRWGGGGGGGAMEGEYNNVYHQ